MELEEIWKDVIGYEGLYQVSNKGRVKSCERVVPHSRTVTTKLKEKILKIHTNTLGYSYALLSKGSFKKNWPVHRIVSEAFIANPENKKCVNHINSNRSDNRVENLEWVTHKENTEHAMKKGSWQARGEKSASCKISNADYVEILRLLKSNTMSGASLARQYKVSPTTISRIKTGFRTI